MRANKFDLLVADSIRKKPPEDSETIWRFIWQFVETQAALSQTSRLGGSGVHVSFGVHMADGSKVKQGCQ